MKNLFSRHLSLVIALVGAGFLFAHPTLAAEFNFAEFGRDAGFGSQDDVMLMIARLIRTALGFLGVIGVGLVLYGGALWMFSKGDPTKLETARKLLINAGIGLVIVLSAFGITQFVLSKLDAVGNGNPPLDVVVLCPPDCPPIVDDDDDRTFTLASFNAACAAQLQNFQPTFTFSQPVSDSSLSRGMSIVRENGDGTVTDVEGTWEKDERNEFRFQKVVTFTPTQVCEGEPDEHCFEPNAPYRVEIDSTKMRSELGRDLECTTERPCEFTFTTGTSVDTEAPEVRIQSPNSGARISQGTIELLQAFALDDTDDGEGFASDGVSAVQFLADNREVDIIFASESVPTGGEDGRWFQTDVDEQWDTGDEKYLPGRYELLARAADCAGHVGVSDAVTVQLTPAHCSNNSTDTAFGETGEDCGGVCGECIDPPVKITRVSPGDGAEGNYITISGTGFGNKNSGDLGRVLFFDEQVAPWPSCGQTVASWTPTQIVVKVPEGGLDGPISVGVRDSAQGDWKEDWTNDGYGPYIPDFDVNSIERPGLCPITPASALSAERINPRGVQFGESEQGADLYIGNQRSPELTNWSPTTFRARVPSMAAARYNTQLFVPTDERACSVSGAACTQDAQCGAGQRCLPVKRGSNVVQFTVNASVPNTPPRITAIDSGWKVCASSGLHCSTDADCEEAEACVDAGNKGPVGQYVTLYGEGFGEGGSVYFTDLQFEDSWYYGLADRDLACEQTTWTNQSIIVQVPQKYSNFDYAGDGENDTLPFGPYLVSVQRNGDSAFSNSMAFEIVDDDPSPGICAYDPVSGPVGTRVSLFGEHFGTVAGKVMMYAGDQTTAEAQVQAGWSDTAAAFLVPSLAQSGPLYAQNAQSDRSNSVPFAVGRCPVDFSCGGETTCCGNGTCSAACGVQDVDGHYAYLFSTRTIPTAPYVLSLCNAQLASPTPSTIHGSATACINAVVSASFSQDMNQTTLNPQSIVVEKCTGSGNNPCRETSDPLSPTLIETGERSFVWHPTGGVFDSGSTYRVTIAGGTKPNAVRAKDSEALPGAPMAEDYSWTFSTSQSGQRCTVGAVSVTPATYTATEQEDPVNYVAQLRGGAMGTADACISVSCEGQEVRWSSASSTHASFPEPIKTGVCTNTALAHAETSGVDITAQITNVPNIAPRFGATQLDDGSFLFGDDVRFYPNGDVQMPDGVRRVFDTAAQDHKMIEYPGRVIINDLNVVYLKVGERDDQWLVIDENNNVTDGDQTIPRTDTNLYTYDYAGGAERTAERVKADVTAPNGLITTLYVYPRILASCDETEPCRRYSKRVVFVQNQNGVTRQWTLHNDKLTIDSFEFARPSNGGYVGVNDSVTNEWTRLYADGKIFRDTDGAQLGTWYGASAGLSVSGTANLEIDFADLNVAEYWPSCEQGVCRNVQLGARFTTDVLISKLTTDFVHLGKCSDESCASPDDVTIQSFSFDPGATTSTRSFSFVPAAALERNTLYKIILEGGITAVNGGLLSETGSDHSWKFQTQDAAETCEVDRVQVEPEYVLKRVVGDTQDFAATPYSAPDACEQLTGQRLNARDVQWNAWTPQDPTFAHLLADGAMTYAQAGYADAGDLADTIAPNANAEVLIGAVAQAAAETNRTATTTINASAQTLLLPKIGSATLALNCACTTDASCGTNTATVGCGGGSCCYERPVISATMPAGGAINVVRNAAMWVDFSQQMNLNTFGGIKPNLYLQLVSQEGVTFDASDCPSNHVSVAQGGAEQFFATSDHWLVRGLRSLFGAIGLVRAADDAPGNVCVMPVTFEQARVGDVWRVQLRFAHALRENATYAIGVVYDNDLTDATDRGLVSASGVGMNDTDGAYATFTTADGPNSVGKISYINIVDNGKNGRLDYEPTSAGLFTRDNEAHSLIATAYATVASGDGTTTQALQPVSEYSWTWDWQSKAADVISVAELTDAISSSATATAEGINGETYVIAEASSTDTSDRTEDGQMITKTAKHDANILLRAFMCENPWPSTDIFADTDNNAKMTELGAEMTDEQKTATFFDRKTNFGFIYCRDNGGGELLPNMEVALVNAPTTDIQKEFLFTLPQTRDALGVRVLQNNGYLPPARWYREDKKFFGAPAVTQLDGYEAATDANTVYAFATNVQGGKIFPNIYAVSYNADASERSKQVFNQVLSNLHFNANTDVVSDVGFCRDAEDVLVRVGDNALVSCASNLDCTTAGATCDAEKSKLRRDTFRYTDVKRMTDAIGESTPPTLVSGTFVRGRSVSTWPSWNAELGNALGAALPLDPLNRFKNCNPLTGAAADTCFDSALGQFSCSDGSFVYGYTGTTEGYTLHASFESPDSMGVWQGTPPSATPFCTATALGNSAICGDGVKGIVQIGGVDVVEECELDEINPQAQACTTVTGSPGQIHVSCKDDAGVCKWKTVAESPLAACAAYQCGNGVPDVGEECDDGVSNGRYGYCGSDCKMQGSVNRFYCGDGTLSGGEQCDCGEGWSDPDTLSETSWAKINDCGAPNGQYASSGRSCSFDCRLPGPSCGDLVVNGGEACDGGSQLVVGSCATERVCGNGPNRGEICLTDDDCNSSGSDDGICGVELHQTYKVQTCRAPNDPQQCTWNSLGACISGEVCGDGIPNGSEQCDDGNSNNEDSCTNECRTPVCGDGVMYRGFEQCDSGDNNGRVCSAEYGGTCTYCGVDCRMKTATGGYCGDGELNGDELCDPEAPVDEGLKPKYCYNATTKELKSSCLVNADCDGSGFTCQEIGSCNGGVNATTGVSLNGNICRVTPPAGQNDCGTGGTCVPPVCAASCGSSCPISLVTTSVPVRPLLAGAEFGQGVDLYSFDSTNSPNRAVLQIPACTLATALHADVRKDDLGVPNSMDIVFVTDLSGSMKFYPDGTTDSDPNYDLAASRMEIIKNVLKGTSAQGYSDGIIGELFDAADRSNRRMRIGLVGFSTTATIKSELSFSSDLVMLGEAVNNFSPGGWTHVYKGVQAAVDMLATSRADKKIVVLLADGEVSHSDDGTSCTDTTNPFPFLYGGFNYTKTGACVAEIRNLMDTTVGVEFYSATIVPWIEDQNNLGHTDPDDPRTYLRGYGEHMSSNECNFANYRAVRWHAPWDCRPRGGIDYAYYGATESAISAMYGKIRDNILGVIFGSVVQDSSGLPSSTDGGIGIGSNQLLPFPKNFSCTGNQSLLPITVNFFGPGTMRLENFSITYCPAQ